MLDQCSELTATQTRGVILHGIKIKMKLFTYVKLYKTGLFLFLFSERLDNMSTKAHYTKHYIKRKNVLTNKKGRIFLKPINYVLLLCIVLYENLCPQIFLISTRQFKM